MKRKSKLTPFRRLKKKVSSAKTRSASSNRWLKRQINDPYVIYGNKIGYRSRAAFKLIEIDNRFNFLKPGKRVVDLGAAPGGWSQVAVERVNALGKNGVPVGKVIGIDQSPIEAIPGAKLLKIDITEKSIYKQVNLYLEGSPDVVLSDMATPATGHITTDHIRIMALLEIAVDFALNNLRPGGVFLGKVLKGGTESKILEILKKKFEKTKHVKPPASRKNSRESFVIAMNFSGKSE